LIKIKPSSLITGENPMKTFNVFLTILFLFVFCSAILAEEVLPQRGICAHRGENGVFPENTVIGFQEAVRLGAAQVEFDVWRTKDKRLIITHIDIHRNTTFEEIRKLDVGIKKGERFIGTRVQTLEEALDSLPRNVWINVHIKPKASNPVDVAAMIIEKKREHQAFLLCNNNREALKVREKYPQIKICSTRWDSNVPYEPSEYIRKTIEWKFDFIQLVGKLGSPEEMKALKDAGIRINFTMAENPKHFKELIEAGVDFPLVDRTGDFVDIAKTLGILIIHD
jgi:glycerophosphoryl diester phosphodiesterase